MPYRLAKTSQGYCVESETGENKGCSETRGEAVKHMAALYAAEGNSKKDLGDLVAIAVENFTKETGEVFDAEDLDEKDWGEPPYFHPWGAKTYAEVEGQREAIKKARAVGELLDLFPTLARNTIDDSMISDKGGAIEALAGELAEKIAELTSSDGDAQDDSDASDMKEISRREDVSAADRERAVSEYGDVRYADTKNKKYPIDTPAHIRAAWSYVNMPRNARKYEAGELKTIKSRIVSAWKSKIDKKGPPSTKEIMKDIGLLSEYVGNYVKAILGKDDEDPDGDLMIWKDASGQYRWLARYSNHFIDDDTPPDIISEKSHRRYVEMVEAGEYPYPVIELWHEKNWEFGKADWVAYDDSGFALASGFVYPGCEGIAESLSKLKNIGVSHGMPVTSVVRDPGDPRVIVEHQTVEISPLPLWAAANKLTSFQVMKGGSTEEDDMGLPKDKKMAALKNWGVNPQFLDQLEALNQKDADAATEAGIEHKEADNASEVAAEVVAETPSGEGENTDPVDENSSAKSNDDALPGMKEVAEAFAEVVGPMVETIKSMQTKIEDLEKQITDVKAVKDEAERAREDAQEKQKAISALSPVAALMASFASARAVGDPATEVKEGDELSGLKPKEANATGPITGIQFLDAMLTTPGK